METLPSLTLRPPLGFRSGLVPRTTYSPFGVSSSLGVRGVALCNIPCLIVELYFLNMAWLDIKSIVKLIKFSFHVALQVLLFFLWPPFPPTNGMGLDFSVRSFDRLPFEPSLAEFIFVCPFHFLAKGATYVLPSS